MRAFEEDRRVLVAGSSGLVGSALVRRLRASGFRSLLLPARAELDLTDQAAVSEYFRRERIEFAFIAAAHVGGIAANSKYPADFLYENLAIAGNVIHAAFEHGVEKLLFLGSSCIYPRLAPQPMREEYLLTGPLEPTNEAYAIAKIAGLKLCAAYHRQFGRRFISAMPTNLYGPGDNFDLLSSHVIPGMMRRFHEAKINAQDAVTVWGSGTPRREFLHVDDLAEALCFLMKEYEAEQTINVGTGTDLSILELAELMRGIVGYGGRIELDPTKPDGAPRKLLDVSRLSGLGWRARIALRDGLASTYRWALDSGAFDVRPR